MMAVSMVSVVSQGGFTVAPKLLMPKFSRLNPLQGMKRLVGAQGWWSLAKALVKTAVLGGVAWAAVHHLVTSLPASGALTLASVLQVGTSTALTLVRWTAVAGVLLSAGDYAMVRRRNNKALKMTKHEVKEEMRQAEGDPHIKSTRRSRAIALTRQRMFAAIQAADVVVVNPTHVAVALKYEANKGAPRVVAKGADAVAARIRATAEQHRVPMVEDVPLARALYKACDVGQEIPVELFQAVASVLAFLFRLRKRGSVAGMHRLA
jgi:flagellar biosynthetic protein FlhB